MNTIATPVACVVPRARWRFWSLFIQQRRRRRVTLDLINASPHLLRDIGALEPRVTERRR